MDRTPEIGEWVVYGGRYPGQRREDGEVTEVINDEMVRVRYAGDRTSKATYIADLEPGRTP